MAQPAISRSIQELERELGVQLFERTKTGMVMTQVGEMVIRRAKIVQSEIQRTLDDVDHFKGQDVGSVSIGLSTAAHVAILPKVLAPFRMRFPKVRFKLREGLFPSLETDIRDGLIDIYVGPVPKDRKSDDLIIEHLFEKPPDHHCTAGPSAGACDFGARTDRRIVGNHPGDARHRKRSERDLRLGRPAAAQYRGAGQFGDEHHLGRRLVRPAGADAAAMGAFHRAIEPGDADPGGRNDVCARDLRGASGPIAADPRPRNT